MSFLAQLRAIWSHHGTKVLGFGGAIVGTIALIDRETADHIGQLFGPIWGHRVTLGIWIANGFGTAWRGYSNSNRNPSP